MGPSNGPSSGIGLTICLLQGRASPSELASAPDSDEELLEDPSEELLSPALDELSPTLEDPEAAEDSEAPEDDAEDPEASADSLAPGASADFLVVVVVVV